MEFIFSFVSYNYNYWTIVARHVKFGMAKGNSHTHKSGTKYYSQVKNNRHRDMWNFDIISNGFGFDRIFQKIKLYNNKKIQEGWTIGLLGFDSWQGLGVSS
jgi:hypothetical protein